MRLTTLSEYGLLALIYLSRQDTGKSIPLSEIAKAQKLPVKYMEHIMQTLCRAGLLLSARGKMGGYRLRRSADKITVAEVVRLFDGPLAPTESVSKFFYRSTPIEKEKKLVSLMRDVRDYTARKLESVTITELR